MGIKPDVIAGTSMGAIVGSLYAAGAPASEIRSALLGHIITKTDTLKTVLEKRKNLVKWFDAFRIELRSGGGVVKTDRFLEYLYQQVGKQTFEELEIPLTVIAADYWEGEEVRFNSGEILPAVQASMAVPGVFIPVEHDGRILVDGGIVNQVPYDVFFDECDITIAVDVTGVRFPTKETKLPTLRSSLLGSFEILQSAQLHERMNIMKPDILVQPPIENVGILEFDRMEDVFDAGQKCADQFRVQLKQAIDGINHSPRTIFDFLPIG